MYINEPIEKGVILQRRRNPETLLEEVATNVPQDIVYHSPTGFEWGYGGSGPADLALNLAEIVVQKAELVSPLGLRCTELAWDVHQHVKELLIMNLPQAGAYIPWKLVCYTVYDALRPGMQDYLFNQRRLKQYIEEL